MKGGNHRRPKVATSSKSRLPPRQSHHNSSHTRKTASEIHLRPKLSHKESFIHKVPTALQVLSDSFLDSEKLHQISPQSTSSETSSHRKRPSPHLTSAKSTSEHQLAFSTPAAITPHLPGPYARIPSSLSSLPHHLINFPAVFPSLHHSSMRRFASQPKNRGRARISDSIPSLEDFNEILNDSSNPEKVLQDSNLVDKIDSSLYMFDNDSDDLVDFDDDADFANPSQKDDGDVPPGEDDAEAGEGSFDFGPKPHYNSVKGTETIVRLREKRRQHLRLLMHLQYLHADLSAEMSSLPPSARTFIGVARYLRVLGISDDNIIRLAHKLPRFFDFNPSVDLQPKVNFLLNLRWSQDRINHLITHHPSFFFQNIHNIAFKFQYLFRLGFSLHEFPYIVNSTWSSMSTRDIEARVRWLSQFGMRPHDIRDALRASTRLFTYPVRILEHGVLTLLRAGFPRAYLAQTIRRAPVVLQSSTHRLTLLRYALQSLLGISQDQFFSSFIGRWPHLSFVHVNTVYRLFSFLSSLGYTQENIRAILRHQGTAISTQLKDAVRKVNFISRELFLPLSLPIDRREYHLAATQVLSHVHPLNMSISNALNVIALRGTDLSLAPVVHVRPTPSQLADLGDYYRQVVIDHVSSQHAGRFTHPLTQHAGEVPLSSGSLSPAQLYTAQARVLRSFNPDDIRLRDYPTVDADYWSASFGTMENICFDLVQRSAHQDRMYLLSRYAQISALDYQTLIQSELFSTLPVDELVYGLLEDVITSSFHQTPPINLIPSHTDKDQLVTTYTTDGDNIIAVLNNQARVPLKLSLSTVGYKESFTDIHNLLEYSAPEIQDSPFPQSNCLFSRQGRFRAYIPSQMLSHFLSTHVPEAIVDRFGDKNDVIKRHIVTDSDTAQAAASPTTAKSSKKGHNNSTPAIPSTNGSSITTKTSTVKLSQQKPFQLHTLEDKLAQDDTPEDDFSSAVYTVTSSPIGLKLRSSLLTQSFSQIRSLAALHRFYNEKVPYNSQLLLSSFNDQSILNDSDNFAMPNLLMSETERNKHLYKSALRRIERDLADFTTTMFNQPTQLTIIPSHHEPRHVDSSSTPHDFDALLSDFKKDIFPTYNADLYHDFISHDGVFFLPINEARPSLVPTNLQPQIAPGMLTPEMLSRLTLHPHYSRLLRRFYLQIEQDWKSLQNGDGQPSVPFVSHRRDALFAQLSQHDGDNEQPAQARSRRRHRNDDDDDDDDDSSEVSGGSSSDEHSYDLSEDNNGDDDDDSLFGFHQNQLFTRVPHGLPVVTPRDVIYNNLDLWQDPPRSARAAEFQLTPQTITDQDYTLLQEAYTFHTYNFLTDELYSNAYASNGQYIPTSTDDISVLLDQRPHSLKKTSTKRRHPATTPHIYDSSTHQRNHHQDNDHASEEDGTDANSSATETSDLSSASSSSSSSISDPLHTNDYFPGFHPIPRLPGEQRFYVVNRRYDRRINREYPGYNVMLDYTDASLDLFDPSHISLLSASLPFGIQELDIRPLPFIDLNRLPRDQREWRRSLLLLRSPRTIKRPTAQHKQPGTEVMAGNRVRLYPNLFHANRPASHSHLLQIHVSQVQVDDPRQVFQSELTHAVNEHLALIARLRLILQDRQDGLQQRKYQRSSPQSSSSSSSSSKDDMPTPSTTIPSQASLQDDNFLADLPFFFAHLTRVEFTLQRILHDIYKPDFDISTYTRSSVMRSLFSRLLGKHRLDYFVSMLRAGSFFTEFTRTKSWFLLYDTYRNLASKVSAFHAFYSVWISVGSRFAGLHPFATGLLYNLRSDLSHSHNGTSDLTDISAVSSSSSFAFLNVIPGSPHSQTLGQMSANNTIITSSLPNRIFPRAANELLRSMGYALDPRQTLWDAADRGVQPHTERIGLQHHHLPTKQEAKKIFVNQSKERLRVDTELLQAEDERYSQQHRRVVQSVLQGDNDDDDDDDDDNDSGERVTRKSTKQGGKKANKKQKSKPAAAAAAAADDDDDDDFVDSAVLLSDDENNDDYGYSTHDDEDIDGIDHQNGVRSGSAQQQQQRTKSGKKQASSHPVLSRHNYTPRLQSLDEWAKEVRTWALQSNPYLVPPPELLQKFNFDSDSLVLETDPVTGESSLYVYWHNRSFLTTTRRGYQLQSMDKRPDYGNEASKMQLDDPFYHETPNASIWPQTYAEFHNLQQLVSALRPDIPITPHLNHALYQNSSHNPVGTHDKLVTVSSKASRRAAKLKKGEGELPDPADQPDNGQGPGDESEDDKEEDIQRLEFVSPRRLTEARRSAERVANPLKLRHATGLLEHEIDKVTGTEGQVLPDTPFAEDDQHDDDGDHKGGKAKGSSTQKTSTSKRNVRDSEQQDDENEDVDQANTTIDANPGAPVPVWYRLEFPEVSLQAIAAALMNLSRNSEHPGVYRHSPFCTKSVREKRQRVGLEPTFPPEVSPDQVAIASYLQQDIDWGTLVKRNQYLHISRLQQNGQPFQHLLPQAHFSSPEAIRANSYAAEVPNHTSEQSTSTAFLNPNDLTSMSEDVKIEDVLRAVGFEAAQQQQQQQQQQKQQRKSKSSTPDVDALHSDPTLFPAQMFDLEQHITPETNMTTNPPQAAKKIYRPICWCCALQTGVGWWSHPPGNTQEYAASRRAHFYYDAPNIDVDLTLSQLAPSSSTPNVSEQHEQTTKSKTKSTVPTPTPTTTVTPAQTLVKQAENTVGPDYIPAIHRFDAQGRAKVDNSIIMSFSAEDNWWDQAPNATRLTTTTDPLYWRHDRCQPQIFMTMQRELRALSHTIHRSSSQDWMNDLDQALTVRSSPPKSLSDAVLHSITNPTQFRRQQLIAGMDASPSIAAAPSN